MNKIISKQDIFFLAAFSILGVLSRTVVHIGPNIEFVTALSIAGGYFIRNKAIAWAIPLIIMIISDMIIGNSIIYLFTWSAFALAPALGMLLKRFEGKSKKEWGIAKPTATAIGFVLFFYLWTNLGVVLTTTMYTKNLSGLMHSYINALPFLRFQLVGNLIIAPLVWVVCTYVTSEKFIGRFQPSLKPQ
jgi:hypothetical protein